MKKYCSINAAIWMVFCAITSAQATGFDSGSGISLTQPISVRAEGMGDAYTAIASDESGAEGWNPANLYGIPDPEVSALYYSGLVDDRFGAVNFARPLNQDLACGFNLMAYDAGSFELSPSYDSEETSMVSAQRDYLATLTGAYRLKNFSGLMVGANLKFLNSTLLGKYTASALAADLGVSKEVMGHLRAGLAIKNIGTPLKYVESADALPSYALLGLAYEWSMNKVLGTVLAGDAQYDLEKSVRGNIGAEVKIADLIALRGGYKLGYDLNTFTVGLGFQISNIQIDYAFSPTQALNSLHRASLTYMFEQPKIQEAKVEAVEAPYIPQVAVRKPEGACQKVTVQITGVQKSGGRVSKVILNIGSDNQLKVGYQGSIIDSEGKPLAGINISQVEPKVSLAEVISLGRDIEGNTVAVIEIPTGK